MGLEKLTWYSSLIAVAWGNHCVMMEGVRQLLLLSIVSPRLALCKFLISASTPYQSMCSCVASPQHVVAWFVEASHCRVRVVELTAWVSHLFLVQVNLPN